MAVKQHLVNQLQLNLSEEDLGSQGAWRGLCFGSVPCAAGSGGNSGVIAGLSPRNSDRVTAGKRGVGLLENPTMDDNLARREAARPRRVSAAAELGANVSPQDGEVIEVHPARETQPGPGRLSAAGGRMERRNSAPQGVHQRHMPMEPLKFHIPRKTKEKRGGLVRILRAIQ